MLKIYLCLKLFKPVYLYVKSPYIVSIKKKFGNENKANNHTQQFLSQTVYKETIETVQENPALRHMPYLVLRGKGFLSLCIVEVLHSI